MYTVPFYYHSGAGILFAIAAIMTMTSILTAITLPLLLFVYRRRIGQLMNRHGDGAFDSRSANVSHMPAARKFQSTKDCCHGGQTSKLGDPNRLHRQIINQPRFCILRHALGGSLFALVMAVSYHLAYTHQPQLFMATGFDPARFCYLFWMFAWPVVFTTNMILIPTRLTRWGIALSYFLILFILVGVVSLQTVKPAFTRSGVDLPAWSEETPIHAIGQWLAFNLVPTLALLAFRNGHARAVGSLVLGFMAVLSAGLLGVATMLWYGAASGLAAPAFQFLADSLSMSTRWAVASYLVLPAALACIVFGAFGWGLMVLIGRLYRNKTISDQSLGLDAIWVFFGSAYAMTLVTFGAGWALLALAAFALYKVTVRVADRIAISRGLPERGPALLLLRVFSLGKRSFALFEAVTRGWRYLGNVQLIAGTDFAVATVTPHHFLSFLSGRLSRLFINNAASLDHIARELDFRPDTDGRFRVNDFFCHSDTWQPVLSELIPLSEVVLMDLREFSATKAGCIFELDALINSVRLHRLVLVVDSTTDEAFLKQTLQDCWQRMRPESPNHAKSLHDIQIVQLQSLGHRELDNLFACLCAAAA